MRANLLMIIFLALLSIFLLGVFSINYHTKVKKMNDFTTTSTMKSVCVGRFVIDVPSTAVITYRRATVAGWEISTIQESDDHFDLRIRQREELFAARKNEHDRKALEIVLEVKTADVTGKIFMYDRKSLGLMRGGKEVISESVSIDALVRSSGVSFDFSAKLRRPEQIERLEKILHQLQAIRETEIPTSAGFCFDHGLLRDPLTVDNHEHVSLFLGTATHPDLAISLSTFAGGNPSPTLLERHKANDIRREYSSHFHDLRVGPRVINGFYGEEILQRVDELNGVKLHDFMWESFGHTKDVLLPKLTLELSTGIGRPGAPVNSSLSDVEALALWEKISSSLRRRVVL